MRQQELSSLNFKSLTLEFLIPSYKRPDSLIQAILSVASQIQGLGLSDRITVVITDDASPNVTEVEIINTISPFKDFIRFKKNTINKGMSLNIRDMVAASKADFCTVLTDDDRLQPEALQEIVETLDHLNDKIGSFFVPRYSYLEDQSLHCIVCNPSNKNVIIKSNPLNSLKYLHNGFILTGLFFKPKLINFQLWNDNLENSFFPLIYFADLLLKYDCLFINKNWFVHIVLNKCHWKSWGENETIILARLYTDYISVVRVSTDIALSRVTRGIPTLYILREEFFLYLKQMNSTLSVINAVELDESISSRFIYKIAMNIFKINNTIFKPIKSCIKYYVKSVWKDFKISKIKHNKVI